MEFRKILALRGPNIWANSPVLEAWVDLGDLKDTHSAMVPGFVDRLMAWLPGLIEDECSEGHYGGFLVRLKEGTYPAHILEHVTLELQELAGTPVGYGRARETAEEGVYRVVIKYREEAIARACIEEARTLFLAALRDEPYDVDAAVAKLRDVAYFALMGPSTRAIVEAARDRGIPHRRLNTENLVQLGYGAKQRRILTAETDRTGAIAEAIAQDKELTRNLLLAVGVPVPEGRAVTDPDDAWEAARSIGKPVVVKPRDANHGRGVAINLTTREQVAAAFEAATAEGSGVLVERYAPGAEYRVLVVGGKVAAAARREPAQVLGDGRSTITQLVEETNKDPLRGDGFLTPLKAIEVDEIALGVLAEQGFGPDSVPPEGRKVLIRKNINFFNGGYAVDVTDRVHPEVAARCVAAARVVGLDLAGIDVIARDIARPLEEQGGVVVEVNAGPGLAMHLPPSAAPRPVGEAIVDLLFPDGSDGRIPVAAVTGVNGKTTVTRLLAHLVAGSGLRVGMACSDGVYFEGRRIVTGDCSGPWSARAVLVNSEVEAAVLETARGGILREGLGFDRCALAVVTNIGQGDHLGHHNVMSAEDLVRVKKTIVDVVLPDGWAVLNAADPLVAGMNTSCRGGVIYFALDGEHEVIRGHRAGGGRAVFARDGAIVRAEGEAEEIVLALNEVPLTRGGRIAFQVENALAAAAGAWGLGLPWESVRAGLASFDSDPEAVPGRFNVLEAGDATVIVDFGHNPDAMEALVEALDAFPPGRRTVVLSADGDRQDGVIARQAEILAPAVDRVILHEEPARNRGRAPGEIPALLRRGLETAPKVPAIEEVHGEPAAIDHALDTLEPGEVLLVLCDAVDASLDRIRARLDARAAAPAGR